MAPRKPKNTTERIHATHVESNIQGGVDFPLGKLTFLYAPNAGGKDAVLRSITLPLKGAADDLAGKDDVKDGFRLMALAPGRSGEVRSTLTLSNGAEVTWFTESEEAGSAKKPRPPAATGVTFVLADIRKKLTEGGEDAQRQWLLSQVEGSIGPEVIKALIPSTLTEAYDRIKAKVGEGKAEGAALALVRKEANREALEKGREIAGMQTTIDTLGLGALPPAETDVIMAEQRVGTLKVAHDSIPAGKVVVAPNVPEQSQIDAARINVREGHGIIANLAEQIGKLPALDAATKAWLDDAETIQRALITVAKAQADAVRAGRTQHCGICAGGIDAQRAVAQADVIAQQAQALLAQYTTMRGSEAQRNALIAQYNDARTKVGQWEAWVTQAEAARAAVQGATGAEDMNAAQRQEAHAAWQAADVHARKLRADFDSYSRVRRAIDAKERLSGEQAGLKRLVEACDGAIMKLLESGREAFVNRVRTYMPPSDEMPKPRGTGDGGVFDIQLREGERDVCWIGLRRADGVLYTALSGAEWNIVTTAMACALSENEPFSIIIPEERAYWPETLQAWMRALLKAPAQIILTSPTKPAGKLSKKWTFIDLATGKATGGDDEKDVEKSAKDEETPPSDKVTSTTSPVFDDSDDEDTSNPDALPDPSDPKRARPFLPENRGRAVFAGTERAGMLWFKEKFGEQTAMYAYNGPTPEQQWCRFGNGVVTQIAKGRIWIYAPEALVEAVSSGKSTPTPPWATPPAIGGFLFSDVVDNARAEFEKRFPEEGAIVSVDATETGGGRWVRFANGAVGFFKGDKATVYAGTTGHPPTHGNDSEQQPVLM